MTTLAPDRTEVVFDDAKPPYTQAQALAEANRCLYCFDAPCIKVCPTAIDIPTFIRRIAEENTMGAAKTIFEANILGMSCARVCPVEVLCVGDCVYNEMGVPPIQIGKLQRWATDQAFGKGARFFEAGADTGKSVALIGGGPASLAAAHELRRLGHGVTIFERDEYLGGLNTDGVAPYKMKADRALEEAQWVLGIGGVEVRSGVEVPRDMGWEEIEREFDAVFLGVGLGPDRLLMELMGAQGQGVFGAVEFISRFKLGTVSLAGVRHAVVVGGGNTAMDAVRELRGLGVEQVTMVYRGTEAVMSGYAHEWDAAKRQGVGARWSSQPEAFLWDDEGKLVGVRCHGLGPEKKALEGSQFDLPAELVLLAIGQSMLSHMLDGLGGIELEWGRVVTDAHGATGRPGYFAGGDCANGGKEVVNAAQEGKLAAQSIHRTLTGGQAHG